MMKKIWFTWKHNGKRDYVIIDDRSEYIKKESTEIARDD